MSYVFPYPATYPEVTGAGLGPLDVLTQGAVSVPAPTGVATIDTANINTAISSLATTGGIVQLQVGTYAVSSFSRTDSSVTYTGSGTNYTWTDASITSADVGRYVLGAGIQGEAPQILSVTVGSGFVTDIAPGGTVSSASVTIVDACMIHIPGVKIKGMGSVYGLNTVGGTATTRITDAGNGPTILTRGSSTFGGRYGLYDLSVWGNTSNSGVGSALFGLFLSNNSWFYEVDNCDFQYQKVAGIATDYNTNALDVRNTSFYNIGTLGATGPTGGYVENYYSITVSAGSSFYNCLFLNIYGSGITGGGNGGIIGAYQANVIACQFGGAGLAGGFGIHQTSYATYSGYSMVLSGANNVIAVWSEGTQHGDLWVNGGTTTISGSTLFTSSTGVYNVVNYGSIFASGTFFYGVSGTANVNNQGQFSWAGCESFATNFVSGSATIVAAAAAGTGVSGTYTTLGGTTGLGNGGSTNLTALAKGTGTGPTSDVAAGWCPVNVNGTSAWVPYFT